MTLSEADRAGTARGQTIFLFVLPEKVATSLEVDGLSITEAVMRSSSHGLILA